MLARFERTAVERTQFESQGIRLPFPRINSIRHARFNTQCQVLVMDFNLRKTICLSIPTLFIVTHGCVSKRDKDLDTGFSPAEKVSFRQWAPGILVKGSLKSEVTRILGDPDGRTRQGHWWYHLPEDATRAREDSPLVLVVTFTGDLVENAYFGEKPLSADEHSHPSF